MESIPRADVVGYLLRPEYLQRARAQWRAGTLSTPEYKRIEDRAVDAAIAMQEAAGLGVVSDGELRRDAFGDQISTALVGIDPLPAPALTFDGPAGQVELTLPFSVNGRISRRRMVAPEEFAYARAKARRPVKAAVPSPLGMNYMWAPGHSPAAYDDPWEMFAEAARILREEIEEIAALGCTYIQIDAPEVVQVLVDERSHRRWAAAGLQPERVATDGVALLDSLAAPIPGVTFGLHMCRANFRSTWLATGGYERVAESVFTGVTHYDVFLLEYDSPRAGGFEPLAALPERAVAVLGLVSSKTDTLEDRAAVIDGIEAAAKFVDIDRLALSTQCGFASMSVGNDVSESTQQAKLQMVAEVAHDVWR